MGETMCAGWCTYLSERLFVSSECQIIISATFYEHAWLKALCYNQQRGAMHLFVAEGDAMLQCR